MDLKDLMETLANERKQVEKELNVRQKEKVFTLLESNQKRANAILEKAKLIQPIEKHRILLVRGNDVYYTRKYIEIFTNGSDIVNEGSFNNYVKYVKDNENVIKQNNMGYYVNNAALEYGYKWQEILTFIENNIDKEIEKIIIEYNNKTEEMKKTCR